jgi:hypothetical protein
LQIGQFQHLLLHINFSALSKVFIDMIDLQLEKAESPTDFSSCILIFIKFLQKLKAYLPIFVTLGKSTSMREEQ